MFCNVTDCALFRRSKLCAESSLAYTRLGRLRFHRTCTFARRTFRQPSDSRGIGPMSLHGFIMPHYFFHIVHGNYILDDEKAPICRTWKQAECSRLKYA